MSSRRCLVFGGNGSIGAAISDEFHQKGYEVWVTSRDDQNSEYPSLKITGSQKDDQLALEEVPQFDCAVWAQGTNVNDSIFGCSMDVFSSILNANCTYIVSTLNALLRMEKLKDNARLCVISSIWQNISRSDKLSYMVSKSAISGLVKSCAVDLAEQGILINAVLPGVLDTPMTRSVLTSDQISRVENSSGFGRLTQVVDVVNTVYFLCSDLNNAISGQSITVDLGFSNVRQI